MPILKTVTDQANTRWLVTAIFSRTQSARLLRLDSKENRLVKLAELRQGGYTVN